MIIKKTIKYMHYWGFNFFTNMPIIFSTMTLSELKHRIELYKEWLPKKQLNTCTKEGFDYFKNMAIIFSTMTLSDHNHRIEPD
jgi:hypothetical protein